MKNFSIQNVLYSATGNLWENHDLQLALWGHIVICSYVPLSLVATARISKMIPMEDHHTYLTPTQLFSNEDL